MVQSATLLQTMNRKPNYTNFGFASIMGPQLRKLVEDQLLNDIKYYGININL